MYYIYICVCVYICVYIYACILCECVCVCVCVLTSGAAFPVCVSHVQQLSDSVVHQFSEATVVFTLLFTNTHTHTHTHTHSENTGFFSSTHLWFWVTLQTIRCESYLVPDRQTQGSQSLLLLIKHDWKQTIWWDQHFSGAWSGFWQQNSQRMVVQRFLGISMRDN